MYDFQDFLKKCNKCEEIERMKLLVRMYNICKPMGTYALFKIEIMYYFKDKKYEGIFKSYENEDDYISAVYVKETSCIIL